MLGVASGQYTNVLLLGGVWCWGWPQANTLMFCCLVVCGIGGGLMPIH